MSDRPAPEGDRLPRRPPLTLAEDLSDGWTRPRRELAQLPARRPPPREAA